MLEQPAQLPPAARDARLDGVEVFVELRGDLARLDAVEVTVTARSSRADTERNQEGDHFWRQEFTAMVAPRNLIY